MGACSNLKDAPLCIRPEPETETTHIAEELNVPAPIRRFAFDRHKERFYGPRKSVVLWAEGAFHQYHGGTSSKTVEDRDRMLEVFRRQYAEIRGKPYGTRDREPHLFGSYVGPSSALHTESAEQGKMRFTMIRDWGRAEWPYD